MSPWAVTRTEIVSPVARQIYVARPVGSDGATSRATITVSGSGAGSLMVSASCRGITFAWHIIDPPLGQMAMDARAPNLGLRKMLASPQ